MKSTRFSIDRKTGMLIAKNLIVMLVLVIVALFSSFSWFSKNTTATASGITVESKAPDGLEIAIVAHGDPAPADKDYVTGTISLSAENCNFLEDLYFSEITGSGNNDEFYKPKLKQANGVAEPDTDPAAVWDDAEANKHYISFDLYMRSKGEQTVYLKESTSVTPVSSVLTWNPGFDTSDSNPSTYGNFSRDAVVGATRLSIVDSSVTNECKLLWIPAANIQLNDSANELSVNVTDTSQESYKHFYYTVSNDGIKSRKEAQNVTTNNNSQSFFELGSKPELVKLNEKGDDDVYYTEYVTCHFWIEGEDNEARLALTGGKFVLSLELSLS